MTQLFLLTFLLVSGTLSSASAASTRDQIAFDALVKAVKEFCDESAGTCESPFTGIFYSGASFNNFTKYDEVKAAAEREAQVWADTILEGDYASAGPTRLESVLEVKRGAETIAFIVTYFERAVSNVADCEFDESADKWVGDDCVKGRIRETMVFSPDLRIAAFANDYDRADFYED